MKKEKTLGLIALAASGILLVSSANAADAKAPAKTADKATSDTSQCAGKNGCQGANSCKGKDAKTEGTYKCEGANSCKGTSACHTKAHKCAGQNSCKGQGWTKTKDKAECDAAKKGA